MMQVSQTTITSLPVWITPSHGRDRAIWQCMLFLNSGAMTQQMADRYVSPFPDTFGFMDDFGSLVLTDNFR